MLTANRRSNGFAKPLGFTAITCLLVAAAFSQSQPAFSEIGDTRLAPAATASSALNAVDGISLSGAYTDADAAYLQESLQLLAAKMPMWSKYVEASKPLILVIDLKQDELGRAAIAKCCEPDNRGKITFGHHFGTLANSSDADSHSPEARRITFLATLVHEITHVRDQREGRYLVKTDRKTCIAGEKSGLEKQLEFQREALTAELGADAHSAQIYHARLVQNVEAETAAIRSRALWDQYCGAFDH